MTAERVDHMLNEMRTAFGAVARFTAQDGRVNTPGEGDGQEYTAPPMANDRRPTDFGATGGAGGSNDGNNDRSHTPGVTQTSMSDGRIIVQVAPAPAIQLLEQLKDSLLKVIRRLSEPTKVQFEDKCDGRHLGRREWVSLMGECLEGKAARGLINSKVWPSMLGLMTQISSVRKS